MFASSRASGCHSFRLAQNAAGPGIQASAPDIRGTAAVTAKVKVFAVRRPNRVPIQMRIIGDTDWPRTIGCHRPYVAPPAFLRPIRDAFSIWRPVGLNRITLAD